MRYQTRFIPGEEIDKIAHWQFSGVDAACTIMKPQSPAIDEASSSELNRQEGYAQGFLEGRAQAMLEAKKSIDEFIRVQGQASAVQLAALIGDAQAQLDSAAQEMAQGVLELACELSRQVLRHEVSSNPQALLPVIREAMGVFIEDNRMTRIRLNPLDLDVLAPAVRDEFKHLALMLEADPLISRGGCVMESPVRVVDGQIEKRWLRVVGQLGLQIPWKLNHVSE